MSEPEYSVVSLPTPSETYSPNDAVALQLGALETNDGPFENAGIMTAYNFASPANRRSTGPLNRFIGMVRSPEAVRGPVERNENYAEQRATITGPDGRTITYKFGLSVPSCLVKGEK